ncbi:RloB family protein [uncultured Acidaminococcus sp.]|uniref:RloB family protein n=1 Tax=uncultured Acidaminococcus sp. TaxID=352152 RepID=UPI002943815A|nr:RloB family protein [uncultured Acidaminococcus sp.]
MRHISHNKKSRKIGTREAVRTTFYIFTEGKKTEPKYFEEIRTLIGQNAAYKNVVKIIVKGTGKSTEELYAEARKYIVSNGIMQGDVWLVFDKDDFKEDKFNKVAGIGNKMDCNGIQYHAAWSNQCIEYWFLLHFEYLTAAVSRDAYLKKLSQYLKLKGNLSYAKNMDDLFRILTENGNPKQAIQWADKRLKEERDKQPADINPGTTVQNLVRELARYFPEEVKERYL